MVKIPPRLLRLYSFSIEKFVYPPIIKRANHKRPKRRPSAGANPTGTATKPNHNPVLSNGTPNDRHDDSDNRPTTKSPATARHARSADYWSIPSDTTHAHRPVGRRAFAGGRAARLAKTKAIKTLASLIEGNYHRIQFTPDLLPSDITGTEIYRQATGDFALQRGPIFHNLILADEINRAPAKVQSALLEAMAEEQVTVGKHSLPLERLFMVMATQNPIEQEGT